MALALVGSLIVLGGCSGLAPPGQEPPDGTVTPVAVPDTETRSGGPGPNSSLPPGVYGNGSVDTAALFAAHDRVLSNRSYRLAVSMSGQRESRGENGSVIARRSWNTSFTVSVDGERELLSLPDDETDSPIRRSYRDETGVYVYDPRDGSASFRAGAVSPADQFELEPATIVLADSKPVLAPGTAEIEPAEREGDSVFRVSIPADPRSANRSNFESYTAVLFVAESGFVRSVYLEYRSSLGRARIDRETRYTYRDLDATTVTEPEWAAGANASRSDRAGPGSD